MAFEAAALLRRHGLSARRLDGGFPGMEGGQPYCR